MIRDGQLSQPQALAHVTSATAGFSLPTPTASPCGSNMSKNSTNRRLGLSQLANKGMLPTPLARDSKGMMGKKALEKRKSPNLPDTMGGSLNPQFVEEIMGFHLDATVLSVSATLWFLSRPKLLSKG
jgi:hypothetical protein